MTIKCLLPMFENLNLHIHSVSPIQSVSHHDAVSEGGDPLVSLLHTGEPDGDAGEALPHRDRGVQ